MKAIDFGLYLAWFLDQLEINHVNLSFLACFVSQKHNLGVLCMSHHSISCNNLSNLFSFFDFYCSIQRKPSTTNCASTDSSSTGNTPSKRSCRQRIDVRLLSLITLEICSQTSPINARPALFSDSAHTYTHTPHSGWRRPLGWVKNPQLLESTAVIQATDSITERRGAECKAVQSVGRKRGVSEREPPLIP